MKDIFVVVGIVGALALGFLGLSQPVLNIEQVITEVKQNFGANPSPESLVQMFFRDTVVIGGGVFATTSAGSVTYTAASLDKTNLIQHTASAAVTATLPASTTLSSFLPKPGDSRRLFLHAITSNITLAGGTGTELNTASSTKVCLSGSLCTLDFVRKNNSDIEVLFGNASGL